MARRPGRRKHERLRTMRFALWASVQPPHLLTPALVAALLDMSRSAASRWLADLHRATSTESIDGIPGFLTPPHRDITKPGGNRHHP